MRARLRISFGLGTPAGRLRVRALPTCFPGSRNKLGSDASIGLRRPFDGVLDLGASSKLCSSVQNTRRAAIFGQLLLGANLNVEFLKPRLNGARFEGHSVPLELFKDFTALQEMLVEVAKAEFKKDKPHRERIPRNFTAEIDLRLTGIEEGSAILSICLVVAGQLFPNSPNLIYFERARTSIIESIAAAESGAVPRLAPDLLYYFDRFGRSLRPGESISFPQDGRDVVLTQTTRERLMVHAQAKEWTEEIALRARVSEVDKARRTFQLELPNGARLGGNLAEPYRAVILEAFDHYESGRENNVLLKGVVRRDRSGQFKAIESIEHVTPLDPLDVVLRLDELGRLQDGWLDGEGKAPSQTLLDHLKTSFEDSFDPELPLPYLYPTIEGGIQAEWTLNNGWDVSMEVDSEGTNGDFRAVKICDNSEQSLSLSLSQESGWIGLNEALRSIGRNRPEEQTIAS